MRPGLIQVLAEGLEDRVIMMMQTTITTIMTMATEILRHPFLRRSQLQNLDLLGLELIQLIVKGLNYRMMLLIMKMMHQLPLRGNQ